MINASARQNVFLLLPLRMFQVARISLRSGFELGVLLGIVVARQREKYVFLGIFREVA
jgi:hypothetical protein